MEVLSAAKKFSSGQLSRAPGEPGEILQDYLERIVATERRGETREESFYPHLLGLFEWYAEHRGRRDLRVTMIPRKTQACLLDFQLRRGERIAGYVEAKRPATDLTIAERSEQLLRYRRTFPNLLLTDFRQFRLYRNGELAARAEVGRNGAAELFGLLDLFVDFEAPPSVSAAELARQLAPRARILAQRIEGLLDGEGEGSRDLAAIQETFAELLLPGLDAHRFADLYAQTLTYGLLAARYRTPGRFDRRIAGESIPPSSGILRKVFRFITLPEWLPTIDWLVDEIADLLAAAPVRPMLERHLHRGPGTDPVLDFYQTFLQAYDPELRKQRGVYYTPPELVSYVVRSVDRLLRTELGKAAGLADPGVTLLDPAAGTLTFVVEAIRCAVETARSQMGDASTPAMIRDHLLADFFAFELMMAPYAIGHLKVSLILGELGRPLQDDERFCLYLTNALDMRELVQPKFSVMADLSRESRAAGRIKKDLGVTVILGNPPWSGHSANRRQEIGDPTREGYRARDGRRDEGYYRLDGKPLGERNPKWLQDDYVKFLRFAQRKIDQAGEGIVAFVTNHSFLDNPTFRGMRRSLLETFDQIYLLDLHGNGKKGERAPCGSPDANVFPDVRQGAAISLLVKRPGLAKSVLRADLWGNRAAKLRWLADHDVGTTEWTPLAPRGPSFLFAPRDVALEQEWDRGVSLVEIFPVHSVGIVTGRDSFVIDTDVAKLRRRIDLLRTSPDGELLPDAPLAPAGWTWEEAMRRARLDTKWESRFRRILCRPFDWRTIFYADYVVERPRQRMMRHLAGAESLGLVVPRQCKEEPGALVTDTLVAHKAVSAYDINTVFPLYRQCEGRLDGAVREANVSASSLALLATRLGEEPSPELVLQYVYAVLYSPPYRHRYRELLQRDFPRIPLPPNRGVFLELAGLGAVLVDLHLLNAEWLKHSRVRFAGDGSGMVKLREYDAARRLVVINRQGQRFAEIAPEVWDYRIGGYQVLDHWLAARAGHPLRLDEIETFRQIVAAVAQTIRLQNQIAGVWKVTFPAGPTPAGAPG